MCEMDAEKLALQRRIDTLDQYATSLHAALTEAERENARLKAELETVMRALEEEKAKHQHTLECAQQFEKDWLKMKRERDAFREACDVERVAMLERKAMQLEMLEETLKRGMRELIGGAVD